MISLLASNIAILLLAVASAEGATAGAKFATDGKGAWVAVWSGRVSGGGADYDILVTHSSDDGYTWSTPAPLNSSYATDSGNDDTPAIATDGSGTWLVTWSSNDPSGGRGTDGDILVARSIDGGSTWVQLGAVNANATTDTGSDLTPAIATSSGIWLVTWSSNDPSSGFGNDGDILVARSTDEGSTWSQLGAVNGNATTDVGRDEAPAIATDHSGSWLIAWSSSDPASGRGTDGDILLSRSTDAGTTWTPLGAVNANPTTDVGRDEAPSIATDGAGNWLVAWSSDDPSGSHGVDGDILVARSSDLGSTWTQLGALNGGATTDVGRDATPAIGTNGSGTWLVAWSSDDPASGRGTDGDILVARSTDAGTTWNQTGAVGGGATTDIGNDQAPSIATSGARTWFVSWSSDDPNTTTTGAATPVQSRSQSDGTTWSTESGVGVSIPVPLPVAPHSALIALALALLGVVTVSLVNRASN
jgi:hypothetical protein